MTSSLLPAERRGSDTSCSAITPQLHIDYSSLCRLNRDHALPSLRTVSLHLFEVLVACLQNLRLSQTVSVHWVFLFLPCHPVPGENEIKGHPLSLIHGPRFPLPVGPLSRLDPEDFCSCADLAQLPLALMRMMSPSTRACWEFQTLSPHFKWKHCSVV